MTKIPNLDLVPLRQLSHEIGFKDPRGRKLRRQLVALERDLRRKIVIRVGNKDYVDRAFLRRMRGQSTENKLARVEKTLRQLEQDVSQILRHLQLQRADIPDGSISVEQVESPY